MSKISKTIAFACCLMMTMALLPACSATSAKTLIVQVESIEGASATATIGDLVENSEGGMPEGMPSGEAPPEMPSVSANSNSESTTQTPPTAPSDTAGSDNSGNSTLGTPPEPPTGTTDGNSSAAQVPQQPPTGTAGDNMSRAIFTANGEGNITFNITSSTAIAAETMQSSSESTIDSILIGSVLEVTLDGSNNATAIVVKEVFVGGPGVGGSPGQGFAANSGEVNQGTAANTIDTDSTYTGETYASTGDDENALRVVGATVTLEDVTIEKTAGATSNTEDGDFYGMNAGLLITDGANATITNATVNTTAQNGNGVFSYGTNTVVAITDSTITTTADNSGGIQTTGGGTMNASNLRVNTAGNSSAAIRSDRGGGTVVVGGGSYITTGLNSPAVYSTADISVSNATLAAQNSEALVIEGKNSIDLKDSDVSGNMSDTEGTSSEENVHNVMIYQSMSGDAEVGSSIFSMTGGTLLGNNGDQIYVTNTHSIITLSGVTIENKDTDGRLLLVTGNSATRGWGTAGANGAQVEFTADNQILEGDIVVDSISTLDFVLKNGSALTGTINIVNNAEGGTAVSDNAVVTIDSGCTWTLTGDCEITSLENNGTINYNGYTITLADGTVLAA